MSQCWALSSIGRKSLTTKTLCLSLHTQIHAIHAFLTSGSTGKVEQGWQGRRREGCKSSSETKTGLSEAHQCSGEQRGRQTTDFTSIVPVTVPLPSESTFINPTTKYPSLFSCFCFFTDRKGSNTFFNTPSYNLYFLTCTWHIITTSY